MRDVRVILDDVEYTIRAVNVAVGNCRYAGGGWLAAPRANPEDGLLDLVVIAQVGLKEVLALAPAALAKSDYLDTEGVFYARAKKIRVETGPAGSSSPQTGRSSATSRSSSRSYPAPSRSWPDLTTSPSQRDSGGRDKSTALRGGRGPRRHPRDGGLRRGDHARRAVAAPCGTIPRPLPHARHSSLRGQRRVCQGDARVAPGDEVAVLPPVSGG